MKEILGKVKVNLLNMCTLDYRNRSTVNKLIVLVLYQVILCLHYGAIPELTNLP